MCRAPVEIVDSWTRRTRRALRLPRTCRSRHIRPNERAVVSFAISRTRSTRREQADAVAQCARCNMPGRIRETTRMICRDSLASASFHRWTPCLHMASRNDVNHQHQQIHVFFFSLAFKNSLPFLYGLSKQKNRNWVWVYFCKKSRIETVFDSDLDILASFFRCKWPVCSQSDAHLLAPK